MPPEWRRWPSSQVWPAPPRWVSWLSASPCTPRRPRPARRESLDQLVHLFLGERTEGLRGNIALGSGDQGELGRGLIVRELDDGHDVVVTECHVRMHQLAA